MKLNEHRQAIILRRRGYSMKEIAHDLKISKSTASLWTKDVVLNQIAQTRLRTRVSAGQLASAKAKRKIIADREAYLFREATMLVDRSIVSKDYAKLLCAMLYWCEGNKSVRCGVYFTNSDPKLVSKFLHLFRSSFDLDESKFRPCIHLHEYHSSPKQLAFWSKITNIPKKQFIRPYCKPNTGKRIREGYQGCIGIRYHSNDLARQLNAVAKAFLMGV